MVGINLLAEILFGRFLHFKVVDFCVFLFLSILYIPFGGNRQAEPEFKKFPTSLKAGNAYRFLKILLCGRCFFSLIYLIIY